MIINKNNFFRNKNENNEDEIIINEKNDNLIENGKYPYKNEFLSALHYIFLIFCSLNSLLVYLYQFKNDDFIKSIFNVSSDNFFLKIFLILDLVFI